MFLKWQTSFLTNGTQKYTVRLLGTQWSTMV
jgi:hypothetical protein